LQYTSSVSILILLSQASKCLNNGTQQSTLWWLVFDSLLTGKIAGYTSSVSILILLSQASKCLNNGTQQSTLSPKMYKVFDSLLTGVRPDDDD
jgi:hypothetical protein